MDKEIECSNCGAVFMVDTIEDSDVASKPKFCPFCGNDDLTNLDDAEEDDEYDDEDEDDLFADDNE